MRSSAVGVLERLAHPPSVLEQQFATGQPRILQVSSNVAFSYAWDAAHATGTVDHASITIGGAPLDPQANYRAAFNAFLAGGGDGFTVLRDGTDRVSGIVDLDALTAYLAKTTASAPLAAPSLTRVTGNGCQL